MLEDKMRETDWELTQETIEEQVARESYLQWLRDQEKHAQRNSSVSLIAFNIERVEQFARSEHLQSLLLCPLL